MSPKFHQSRYFLTEQFSGFFGVVGTLILRGKLLDDAARLTAIMFIYGEKGATNAPLTDELHSTVAIA
jgi:hypothetical protein